MSAAGRGRPCAGRMARDALIIGLAAALAAACDAPTIPGRAQGYDFRFLTTPPLVLRWPLGSTVRVFVAGGDDPASSELLGSAFRDAASAWRNAVLYGEFRIVEATRIEAADVVLFWQDQQPPVETADCPPQGSGLALTWFCPADEDPARLHRFPLRPPAHGARSDVRMMVYVVGSGSADPDRVRRLVLHELGHVLGIGRHSPDARDVMWSGAQAAELSEADHATIQVLYHSPPDMVP